MPSIFHPFFFIFATWWVAALFAFAGQDSGPQRNRVLFNSDWRFHRGDPANVDGALDYAKVKNAILPTRDCFLKDAPPQEGTINEELGEGISYTHPDFDDKEWRSLNLPHDWGIEQTFNLDAPGETGKLSWWGVGWYRKHFAVPLTAKPVRTYLEVDGAMSYSMVWCNGKFVGGWPYGYSSFQLDLTHFLRPGQDNVVCVRLDNPKDSSRWYPGGGIYRNIWLVQTPLIHVAHWGTFVTTKEITEDQAKVSCSVTVENDSDEDANLEISTQVFELGVANRPIGHPVCDSTQNLTLSPGNSQSLNRAIVNFNDLTVAKPRLWSPDKPALYVAVTTLKKSGTLIDSYATVFGIRTIKFTANNGFLLNGIRTPIHGVCLHHDLGALGAAFNVHAVTRQLTLLKEMGCNAIRTSHNPPAPEVLDLCDQMGFLVMDELTDTWTVPKKPNGYALLFTDWGEADLRAMIRRDRNHPSVILWSIGNEVGEQRDTALQGIAKKLSSIVLEEDLSRPTTSGCDFPDAGYNGFQKTVDVFAYNYKPWEYKRFHQQNPSQPIFGSETASCVSSRGEYTFPVSDDKAEGKIGFQVSSYDLYAPPWAMAPDLEFKGQDESPFVAGEFVWTGFDYLGEPTPFNNDMSILTNYHTQEERDRAAKELKAMGKIKSPARSSYFGIIDLAGFKKDRFYLYQSHWRPELPMAHILPHWNWPERVGKITPVHVYTSGDEAELFLNGTSLGRKKRGAYEYRLRWDNVKYEPGELKVVAYKKGKPWAEDTVRTTGPASKLILTSDSKALKADGTDLAFVTLTIADHQGIPVPRSNNSIEFEVEGPAEIVATDNGDPTNLTSFLSKEREAFNSLALVIVRSKAGVAGPITLRAKSKGLRSAELIINSSSQGIP